MIDLLGAKPVNKRSVEVPAVNPVQDKPMQPITSLSVDDGRSMTGRRIHVEKLSNGYMVTEYDGQSEKKTFTQKQPKITVEIPGA